MSEIGRDGIVGTCAGGCGWTMGDLSEFGVLGCVSDFSAQSEARWRRSSWATMPELDENDSIKNKQLTVSQT
jgi:hypothetical protein